MSAQEFETEKRDPEMLVDMFLDAARTGGWHWAEVKGPKDEGIRRRLFVAADARVSCAGDLLFYERDGDVRRLQRAFAPGSWRNYQRHVWKTAPEPKPTVAAQPRAKSGSPELALPVFNALASARREGDGWISQEELGWRVRAKSPELQSGRTHCVKISKALRWLRDNDLVDFRYGPRSRHEWRYRND